MRICNGVQDQVWGCARGFFFFFFFFFSHLPMMLQGLGLVRIDANAGENVDRVSTVGVVLESIAGNQERARFAARRAAPRAHGKRDIHQGIARAPVPEPGPHAAARDLNHKGPGATRLILTPRNNEYPVAWAACTRPRGGAGARTRARAARPAAPLDCGQRRLCTRRRYSLPPVTGARYPGPSRTGDYCRPVARLDHARRMRMPLLPVDC
jgi:hypothetical protein